MGEDKKLGLMLDLGTMLISPPSVKFFTDFELPDPVAQAELEANLNEEATALEDDMEGHAAWPVIRLAVAYKIF